MKKINKQDLETLLSSYLDGELTASQAQKVEKQLANDADAQQLFQELKEISGWVGDLPQELAPKHLSEDILFDLERNQLLNSHESISEQAGKNHLFLRRFVAAASLLLLVGAVATIIYQVLFGPVELTKPHTIEIEVAKEQTPPVKVEAYKATSLAVAEPHQKPLVDEAAVKYGSLHLEVLAQTGANKATIEKWLTDLAIERFVPMHLNEYNQKFAFFCKAAQLTDLFDKLQSQSGHQIHVVISDSDQQTTLTNVDETQLLQLAMIADRSQQIAMANNWTNRLTVDKAKITADHETIASLQANQTESPIETEPQSLLPDWLVDAIVKIEPELTDLELLGPVDWPQESPVYQQDNHQADLFIDENHIESPPIPAIDPNQMVAIVLTYTHQDKPATDDNNVQPKNILDPNTTATKPNN